MSYKTSRITIINSFKFQLKITLMLKKHIYMTV